MTKPHKITTALLLTAALLLGGCAEQMNSPAQGTENTSSDSNFSDSTVTSNSDSTLTDSGTSVSSNNPESSTNSESEPDLQTLIENFPIENITLPDGSIVNKNEATGGFSGFYQILEFDFTFLRYARPIFRNTLDTPDMVDWTTNGDELEGFYVIEDTNYFKVKPGDKLENGLVVKTAKYYVNGEGNSLECDIAFDGIWTLTGIIRRSRGRLYFWGDPTQYSIPILIPGTSPAARLLAYVDSEEKFALVSDFTIFDLGEIIDINLDISDIFTHGEYQKVKVTLNNITSHYDQEDFRDIRAELIAIDPIT